MILHTHDKKPIYANMPETHVWFAWRFYGIWGTIGYLQTCLQITGTHADWPALLPQISVFGLATSEVGGRVPIGYTGRQVIHVPYRLWREM